MHNTATWQHFILWNSFCIYNLVSCFLIVPTFFSDPKDGLTCLSGQFHCRTVEYVLCEDVLVGTGRDAGAEVDLWVFSTCLFCALYIPNSFPNFFMKFTNYETFCLRNILSICLKNKFYSRKSLACQSPTIPFEVL